MGSQLLFVEGAGAAQGDETDGFGAGIAGNPDHLRAGHAGITLHGLRHGHAAGLIKTGAHPRVVQERLGHSTISITLDTYSHVLPGLQEAAAVRFDEALGEARSDSAALEAARSG